MMVPEPTIDPAAFRRFAGMPTEPDPLIAMWAQRQAAAPDEDGFNRQQ